MIKKIPKVYEPAEVEKRWYAWWEEQGFFRANSDSDRAAYSIVIPPPNVTGRLHMGHALNITLQDLLVRWKRMKGLNVLWLPGTDHAGIATQNVVELQLAEEGKRRTDLGREAFEKVVWKWKEEAESNILGQLRRLGCSCDWSRLRFTLDEGLSHAVREVFVRLYEDGLIYRGEYLVNWCPRCTTAISDLEVEYQEVQGKLWHVRYPFKGSDSFVVVATTRPETMLGDTAVAVHPEDERYASIRNKTIVLPLIGREIPIIADSFVDREFGTGVVKVTPGHDPNDFEAGRRHQLPVIKVIGEDGRMTEHAVQYAGMDRYKARKQVVDDLENQGLLVKVEEHPHSIGHCQRCETVVEPLVSTQWFVRVKPLADPAIQAVKEGKTVFIPSNYERVYFEWMENIHDWCISRQLWWGHRIPAWHCQDCGEITVALEDPHACTHCDCHSLIQESDVLDTWFSSALWPFSTLGWPKQSQDLGTYYPTSALVTGFDIIFFWVARMMMMGLRFMEDVPFEKVYINGLVRDEHGQKMSKSRGNVIDPLEIMDEYGTDAVRFTLLVMAAPGTDIPFSVSRMTGYRAFCNKLWNAGRFLLLNLQEESPVESQEINQLIEDHRLTLEEQWILSRLQKIISETEKNLENFRFHEASNQLYHFFWHEFCDWFIELSKANIVGQDAKKQSQSVRVAAYCLETSLRLLHPFMPFITEELWQQTPHSGTSLMVAPYPVCFEQWINENIEKQMENLQELISAVRTARSENNVDPRKKISIDLLVNSSSNLKLIESQLHHLKRLAQLDGIQFVAQLDDKGFRVQGVSRLAEFSLILDKMIDVKAESQRLSRQIDRVKTNVLRLQNKLENQDFLQKAPEEVVEVTRQHHAEAVGQLVKLKEKLDAINDE